MTVGDYIKELRVSNGYSQEQLGKLLGVQEAVSSSLATRTSVRKPL